MKKSFGVALLAFTLLGSAAPSIGQSPAQTQKQASSASPREQQLYRGTRIIGSTVRDAKDKKIGDIKDLILDSRRGEVAYVVVNFGGVMGVGRKYHAIPWRALEASDNGRYYVLHADRETISQAPGFDKGNWPEMADQKWSAEIDRYWNRTVGRGPFGNGNLTSETGVARPDGAAGATSSGR